MTEAEITLPHHQAHNRMFGGVPWVADVTFHANTYIEVGLSNNIFADFTHHARRSLPQNTPISYFNSISIAVYNYNHQLPLINHSGRANGSIREEPIDNFNFNLQGTHIQTRLVTREVLNPYSPYFNVNFGNTGDNFSINVEYGTGIANRPPRMPDWLIALIVISILIGVILLVGLMKKYVV
ncbi:MAG: hypothetical protein FWE22_08490 [Firmicutes bacterium]|nr:hypothetical protein [Bacillota bacterium]